MLPRWSHLRELDLGFNEFEEAGVAALVAACWPTINLEDHGHQDDDFVLEEHGFLAAEQQSEGSLTLIFGSD